MNASRTVRCLCLGPWPEWSPPGDQPTQQALDWAPHCPAGIHQLLPLGGQHLVHLQGDQLVQWREEGVASLCCGRWGGGGDEVKRGLVKVLIMMSGGENRLNSV